MVLFCWKDARQKKYNCDSTLLFTCKDPRREAFAVTTALLQSAAVGLCSKDAGMGLTVGFAFGYGGLVG